MTSITPITEGMGITGQWRSEAERDVCRRMLEKLRAGGPLRPRRVTVLAIRRRLLEESYENALKVEVAVDRMLAEVGV